MRHRSIYVRSAAAAVLLSIASGCVVTQFGNDQVPDVNVNVTELKDEDVVGIPAAIDSIVGAFLAQPGAPPGCAVGIMIENEVAFVKGYGLATIGSAVPFTEGTPSVVGTGDEIRSAVVLFRT